METKDQNHKDYYEGGRKITPFQVIKDWKLNFFTGNVIKYIARLGRKPDSKLNPFEKTIEDIDKCIVYLQELRANTLEELDEFFKQGEGDK